MISPDDRAALVHDETTCRNIADTIQAFHVTDQTDADRAADWTRNARAVWKTIEEKRTRITRPLLEAKREVDALFAGPLNALEDAQTHLRRELGAYHARVEAARVAAVRTAVAEASTGTIPTLVIPEPATTERVTVKQFWVPSVVDPDLVPREYCSPDMTKVPRPDSPHVQPKEIPGVTWTLTERTTVR